jgi:hypothetical protein
MSAGDDIGGYFDGSMADVQVPGRDGRERHPLIRLPGSRAAVVGPRPGTASS